MIIRLALLLSLILSTAAGRPSQAETEQRWAALSGPLTGSRFLAITQDFSLAEREEAFLYAILAGRLPKFYQDWLPVHTSNRQHRLTFFVKPNYLAIGSDRDHLIVPLNWHSTKAILAITDSLIPTTKMVDLIYAQSHTQLRPHFLRPGPAMATNRYLQHHQTVIDQSLFEYQLHTLISGHKKDIVLTQHLYEQADRMAIYGWHRNHIGTAIPVQPLSLWHGAGYSDYSHGVRLVHRKALLDGHPIEVRSILKDPKLASLLSDEGPIDVDRLLKDSLQKLDQAH